MSELEKREIWSGRYRGVCYEIVKSRGYRGQDSESWCYYVIIHEPQIPKEHLAQFNLAPVEVDWGDGVHYRYDGDGAFAQLEWHCGITFYSKDGGLDGRPMRFKGGCDYQHYWDEGHHYDVDSLEYDAKATIDGLWQLMPDLIPLEHVQEAMSLERQKKREDAKAIADKAGT